MSEHTLVEFPLTPIWTLPACQLFVSQGVPFHLIQLEGPPLYKEIPYPILSRIGLDHNPKDAADPDTARTLVQAHEDTQRLETAVLGRIGLRDKGLVVFKKGWEVVTPKEGDAAAPFTPLKS